MLLWVFCRSGRHGNGGKAELSPAQGGGNGTEVSGEDVKSI